MHYQLALIEYAKRAESRAFERVEEMRVGFRRIERREDLAAYHDHGAEAARFGARSHAHCLEQIRWSVPAKIAYGTHRSREDNRLLRRKRAGHQIRRSLQGVGSVCDHDAGYFRPRNVLADAIPESPHPFDGHVRPRI